MLTQASKSTCSSISLSSPAALVSSIHLPSLPTNPSHSAVRCYRDGIPVCLKLTGARLSTFSQASAPPPAIDLLVVVSVSLQLCVDALSDAS